MEVRSFGIREKIISGFLILVIIFGLNGVYNLVTINASHKVLWELFREQDPSLQNLNKFRYQMNSSLNYLSAAINDLSGARNKEDHANKHANAILEMKTRLMANGVLWKNEEQRKHLTEIAAGIEKLMPEKAKVFKLIAESDAEDRDNAIRHYHNVVMPLANKILESADVLLAVKEMEKRDSENQLTSYFESLKNGVFTLGVLIIMICLAVSYYISSTVLNQIKEISKVTEDLSKGIHPPLLDNVKNDEVGNMAKGINKVISGLKETTEFAESIGKGDFEAEFVPLSEEDVLGNSLINMRDNLKKITEEDKKRNWANEGYARFSDLLRTSYEDKHESAFAILSALVKYLDANQGMFYIVNSNGTEEHLELAAAYAWSRRKYMEENLKKGEGLAGQAWVEGEYIFMTDVPEEYVQIRSGTGLATPRSIMVVPLKYNEQIFGVVELASFHVFTKAEIDFILKLSENIAATLSNTVTAERMKKLLDDTQSKTQLLKEQEEEMRQNLEELEATQEDMKEREKETNNELLRLRQENESLKRMLAQMEGDANEAA